MTLAGGWVLAPLVLAALCTGAGLLAVRVSGAAVPGPVVPGVGLALLIAVAGVLTLGDATARLAPAAGLLTAIAGFAVAWRDLRWRPGPAVAAAGAFAVLAWPSLGSGQGSVTGYIKLDDSAIWLGLIAHLMEHGRDLGGVAPSTFRLDLVNWLGNGYPVGAFTPVGVVARLTGQDYANVYQPAIAVYGAIAALGFHTLAGGGRRGALCALVAVQASLFYGYAQWGSIKEIAAVALLVTLAVVGTRGGGRALLLAALPAGALLDTYGAGGVIWAGTGMAVAALLWLARERALLRTVAAAAGAVAVVAVSAIPAIAVLGTDARATTGGSPSDQADIGKLVKPLDTLQGAGLWPAGDFRYPPDPRWPVVALAVGGLALAAAAVVSALRRREWALPVTVGVVLLAAAAGLRAGGPWIDAKVLAITAPFLLLATAVAARRAVVVVLVVALLSSWLAARDVYVAPRAELAELSRLGDRLAGQGPALVLNYEGYATRYFLGPADGEGATDLRVHQIRGRDGRTFPAFSTVEVDDVAQAALFRYRVLVRRRTPVGSRMPGGYRRVHAGAFFEAFRRAGPLPARHVPLGTDLAPAAPLECRTARRYARSARRIVAAPAVNPVLAGPAAPPRDGRATVRVTLPRSGVWRVWVGGGVLGRLEVALDGRSVGRVRHQLDASVGWLRFGARRLGPGPHRVTLDYARGAWRPGRGGPADQLPLGPVALSLETQPALVDLPSAQVDRLCDGRDYDWLETY